MIHLDWMRITEKENQIIPVVDDLQDERRCNSPVCWMQRITEWCEAMNGDNE